MLPRYAMTFLRSPMDTEYAPVVLFAWASNWSTVQVVDSTK